MRTHAADDFSLAAPPGPLLAKDDLLERFAWLAYLVQHEPGEFGGAFLREWLRARQHHEYARLSIANVWNDKTLKEPVKRANAEDFQAIAAIFGEIATATRPLAEDLVVSRPEVAAGAIRKVHFLAEVRSVIDLLGGLPAHKTRLVLEAAASSHPELAGFARVRLAAADRRSRILGARLP